MLIEIHMLQNHAPSNLNRDDTGSPKDCVFGGVRRARISSQCLKRSIRRSPVFTDALRGVDMAVRTRQLPEQVRQILIERGLPAEMAAVAAAKASGFGNKEGKEQKEQETAQMMLLSPTDIQAVADVLHTAATEAGSPKAFEKVGAKELQEKAVLRGWRPITPDIALFGRMITSDAFRDVEAAMQVAHALSTHKMEHEFDYFTAVDDIPTMTDSVEDKGAGMIGDIEFNSACYYKYFSLDVSGLVANLAGPAPSIKGDAQDKLQHAEMVTAVSRIVRQVVPAFLKAAVFTTPSGKQNTFAAHQLPDAILVEVREQKMPVSYANAFVKPVSAREGKDLVEQSLLQFKEHVEVITRKFSLTSAARLWFSTRDLAVNGATACETLDDLLGNLGEVLEGRLSHG